MIDYLDFKEMKLKLEDIQKTTYKCRCGHKENQLRERRKNCERKKRS